ncbi:MAG: DUF2273 domain-containing protein [Fusobacterium sp.]|nr:DUF2273 domain-containing protein [Fusobacterium sp.]
MPENILEIVIEKIVNNWRKYFGCIAGFIIGIILVKYGFLKAIIIFALAFFGYKLGDISFAKKLKKDILKILKED